MTDAHDTPTQRAAINQLSVDELDAMLEGIRERRLARVKKLEEVAKVKADDAQLTSWLKFERAYKIASRYMKRFEEMEQKADKLIHKVRVAALVVQFEVTEDDS